MISILPADFLYENNVSVRGKTYALAVLALMAGLGLFLCCCDDCPTCPGKPAPGSYYVYLSDDNQSSPAYIWVIDSGTDSLIDSIPMPYNDITYIDVSPNGDYLAGISWRHDSVYIFDTRSKEIHSSMSAGGVPIFTHDNSTILNTFTGRSNPRKCDIHTGATIAQDTLDFTPYGLCNNSPYVYGMVANYDSLPLCIYNYEEMRMVKAFRVLLPDGTMPSIRDMTISPDDKYFYFIVRPGKVFKWDIAADSIIDSLYLQYGSYFGEVKCTPDGRYLLASETVDWNMATVYWGTIAVIDLTNFKTTRRISTHGIWPLFPGAPINIGQFRITPDGTKAFGVPYTIGVVPPASFNLIDLTSSLIGGLTPRYSSGYVAIGKRIEK